LIPLLNNDELCEYLKKMIRKLDLSTFCVDDQPFSQTWERRSHRINRSNDILDDCYQLNKMWETFSNIEQIKCTIDSLDPIVFLLTHLPKLLRMNIWLRRMSFSTVIHHLEKEADKRGIRIITQFNSPGSKVASIWITRRA
jgi:hypothetical protein